MIQVDSDPALIRDEKNQAVLNTDNNALEAYKKRKAESGKVSILENKMNVMQTDLSEIKRLLKRALS